MEMMRHLHSKKGVEPVLLVPGGGIIGKLCEQEGIPVIPCDFRISYVEQSVRLFPIRRITRRIMRFVDYFRVYRVIRKAGYTFELIHTNSSIFDIGYFLSKWLKVPHVWHIREDAEEGFGLYPCISRRALIRQYKNSRVIAISKSIGQKLEKLGYTGSRIVYDGVDIVNEYAKEYYSDGMTNFCIVGVGCQNKNQLDVVKAFNILWEKGYENIHLHIIGGFESEYRKLVDEYIAAHDEIKNRISIYGHVDNVQRLLYKMDVGISASSSEAFGRTTIEEMANYMPVIGTDIGGTAEILADSENRFQVHDVERLAELMEKYINSKDDIERDGNEARKRAEHFTSEQNAEGIWLQYCISKKTRGWLLYELLYHMRLLYYKERIKIASKKYASEKVLDEKETNELISNLILQGKPAMVARLGGNECCNMAYWKRHDLFSWRTDARQDYLNDLCMGAGFFPNDMLYAQRFVDVMCDSMKYLDLIGKWDLYMEEWFIKAYANQTKVTYLTSLEPWRLKKESGMHPWTSSLEGKKVLVIHPFSESIAKQYNEHRDEIFSYFDECTMLPEFELHTIKAVQSIAGTKTEYDSWFDALDDMTRQCESIDFDVAIIGCGAYGFPLAARIKQMGKIAIHLGGATQLLFGIRGKRWDEDVADIYRDMVNDSWIRPASSEMPENAKLIEKGCYW